MPTISSAGLGSGLDVPNLVEKLVTAEGDPVRSRLDRKEVDIQQGLTAIGTFKGALLDFQSSLAPLRKSDAFKSIKVSSSDEDKFLVVADENAITGSYDIEISQLALSQKLKSQTFDSEFDAIGSGTISIEFGKNNSTTNSFDVNAAIPLQRIEIDEENNSLRGIQEAINQANVGVRASIINDGTGYLLILNAEKTGAENSLRISITDSDGNDTDLKGLSAFAYNPVSANSSTSASGKNLEETTSAKDAIFSIDGIKISNGKNEIKDSIPGVSLTLKKLTNDNVESFTVEKDLSGIKESIKTFVSSYNELINTVSILTGYDPETGQSGPLSGDSSIRGIIEQIRQRLGTSFNGINENLGSHSSIGIDTSRDGTLTLDEVKLEHVLQRHENEIKHLFSAAVSTSDKKIRVSSEKIPTINGVFEITLSQAATSGKYAGQAIAFFPLTIDDLTGSLALTVDNVTTGTLKLPPRTYLSGEEFASELQRVINQDAELRRNNISATVSISNNAFEIKSDTVGNKSSVAVSSINNNLAAATGIFVGQGSKGIDLKGRVNDAEITGSGTKLKLDGELKGIVLDVHGKQTGNRGKLVVTNGIAARLDNLTESFLASTGLLEGRVDGYNSRIKDIEKQREDLVRKLEVSEERYLKQFSNLDAMLGKMRSTSNFLSEKLSALPGGK